MAKTVFKYRAHASAQVPAGAKSVLVGHQDRVLTVWLEVDFDAPKVHTDFVVFGTGHKIPEGFVHCGSWIDDSLGPFVWHLYMRQVS